jgi:hypothetical protein
MIVIVDLMPIIIYLYSQKHSLQNILNSPI